MNRIVCVALKGGGWKMEDGRWGGIQRLPKTEQQTNDKKKGKDAFIEKRGATMMGVTYNEAPRCKPVNCDLIAWRQTSVEASNYHNGVENVDQKKKKKKKSRLSFFFFFFETSGGRGTFVDRMEMGGG